MNIAQTLADELQIRLPQVEATLRLLDEGDTIPFIARYRKEVTGSLDDVTLRRLEERLAALKSLEERRESILSSLTEQGKLTDELKARLDSCAKLSELESLYRPFKKKKRTRATIAKEAGLAPLAEAIKKQKIPFSGLMGFAKSFESAEKGVASAEDALQGAKDILAEEFSDSPRYYERAKDYINRGGKIESKQTKADVNNAYLTYASFACPVRSVKNYQVLALNRGENEKCLSVSFSYDRLTLVHEIVRDCVPSHSDYESLFEDIAEDAFDRLIAPSVENDIRNELFEKAEDSSIALFKENLRQLLMVPPLKGKRVLGFDPAFVNGCKLASVDERGKLLRVGVIYPTIGGANRIEESKKTLLSFFREDHIDVIALGNGTAGRESEAFLKSLAEETHLPLPYVIVNEAGASVYSASELGSEEFPDLSVEKRSAISLARRLQDPLSELVKIEPTSIGVGQYQHDMDKKKLSEALHGVVEDTVNEVGVYLNNASPSLLSYVSGIGMALAKGIVDYRNANGPFQKRSDLKKVPHLGPKAFEQCAGFLRIQGPEALDNTAVHPESYPIAIALLKELGLSPKDLSSEKAKAALSQVQNTSALQAKLGVGEATLQDILLELEKPGRDPREDVKQAVLKSEVADIKDLKVGMTLDGTVRNVMDFGVFVDIGVHVDGLVHISEMADHFVSSPLEIVHINDIVSVRVLSVDAARKRIGLSMRKAKD